MLQIEVKLKGIEGLSKSQVNRALKKANELTGVHFRYKMLPSRFTEQGGRRLKYTPRSGEFRIGAVKLDKASRRLYAVKKFRKLGHSDPLVFSGEGKREALSKPTYVRSTRDKIVIPLPRKFNFKGKGSRVNMSDEIRRVTDREASALTKVMVANIESQLALVAGSSRFHRVESASITNG